MTYAQLGNLNIRSGELRAYIDYGYENIYIQLKCTCMFIDVHWQIYRNKLLWL